MTDDGSSKEKYPDDSHSGYNDAELTPEQPDPNSGQTRDDEPAQELSQDREATQRFSTNPDGYDNQQYPQQSDYQNAQYHKTGISTPRAAMLGEARVLPPDGASQQASIPSKAGTDKTPSRGGTPPSIHNKSGKPVRTRKDGIATRAGTLTFRAGTASPEHRSMTPKALRRLLSTRVTSIISKTTYPITSTAMVNVGLAGTAHLERSSLPRRHMSLTHSQISATWLREHPQVQPAPTMSTSANRSAGSHSAMLPNLHAKANTGLLPLQQFSSLPSAPEYSSI
ncbi:hypothetical protein HMPREF9599_02342 [Cutibacterium acnes HL050PA2]|nr:hypothetical protein HMPREF9599_02342 [Cutibacterium acnes HL050PA2]